MMAYPSKRALHESKEVVHSAHAGADTDAAKHRCLYPPIEPCHDWCHAPSDIWQSRPISRAVQMPVDEHLYYRHDRGASTKTFSTINHQPCLARIGCTPSTIGNSCVMPCRLARWNGIGWEPCASTKMRGWLPRLRRSAGFGPFFRRAQYTQRNGGKDTEESGSSASP